MNRLFFSSALAVLAALCLTIVDPVAARTLTDASGTRVDVPDAPVRVVALSERDLDAALALGVTPIATINGRGQSSTPRYLGDRAAEIDILGNFMQPSLGALIEKQPDLILAGGVPDAQLIGRLRRIAPTVITYEGSETWQTSFERIAEVLDRTDEHASFMANYRQRADRLRNALGQRVGNSVSIVRWSARGPLFMLRDAFASRVLADVGLVRPPAQRRPGVAHSPPLSLEALDRLDADWLFLGTLRAAGESDGALKEARAMPAFHALGAVKQNHVVVVDGSLWTSNGGPLAACAVLNDVAEAMTPP